MPMICFSGIKNDDHVVIYDRDPSLAFHYSTCRAWWLFKLFGHQKVSILYGGFNSWLKNGGQINDTQPKIEETNYIPKFEPKWIVDFKKVEENSLKGSSEFQLIDARQKNDFQMGHISHAKNIPFNDFYEADGSFKSTDQIEVGIKAKLSVFICVFIYKSQPKQREN